MKLGTARDLVVEYEVKRDNDAELTLVDSKFKLDRDNLEIGSPRWVQTNGIWMTKSRVASGLHSGLSSNIPLLERLLGAELPNIFQQIEDEIDVKIYAAQVVSLVELATR